MTLGNLRWLRGVGLVAMVLAPLTAQAESEAPAVPTAVQGKAEVVARVAVGQWPEGITVNGRTAWLAISGKRKLTGVDLDGLKPIKDLPAGRLPVEMGTEGGVSYALSHTDKKVWAVKGSGANAKATAIHEMPDCPEDMAVADGQAWVLLWTGCSSAGAMIVRASLTTKAMVVSKALSDGAWDIAHGHGQVWVMHDDGNVAVIDPRTMATSVLVPSGESYMKLAVGPSGVYATGRVSSVTRIDPATRAVSGKATLKDRVAAIWADDAGVMVMEVGGRLTQLDPVTLAVVGQWASPEAGLEPQALVRDGDRWLVTSHKGIGGDDKAGSLWVLKTPAAK